MSTIKEERESKMLWVVTDSGVKQLKCYSCKPNNPESWWCPEAGFTGTEGYHMFDTKREALTKAILRATEEWTRADRALSRLKKEFDELPR